MEEELTDQKREKLESMRTAHSRILVALEALARSEEWGTLKELLFDEALSRIDRLLLAEALKPDPDPKRMIFLQGERSWARRYCDVKRFADFHKSLLEELNNQLK